MVALYKSLLLYCASFHITFFQMTVKPFTGSDRCDTLGLPAQCTAQQPLEAIELCQTPDYIYATHWYTGKNYSKYNDRNQPGRFVSLSIQSAKLNSKGSDPHTGTHTHFHCPFTEMESPTMKQFCRRVLSNSRTERVVEELQGLAIENEKVTLFLRP